MKSVHPFHTHLEIRPTTVPVSLTLNGESFSLNNQSFTYIPDFGSAELNPNFGSVYGGTLVDVMSPLIRSSKEAACSFGGIVVNAASCISGKLTCRTPSAPSRCNVAVRFSINGKDFYDVPGLTYSYIDHIIIHHIEPDQGSVDGDMVLSIYSENVFASSNSTYCRFGDLIVPSVFTSSSLISCILPPLHRTYEVQTISFGLTPFRQSVQKISIYPTSNSAPFIAINIQSKKIIDQVERIEIGHKYSNNSKIESLSHTDTAVVKEVQIMQSSFYPQREIQAIILRTNFESFSESYGESFEIVYHKSIAVSEAAE